MYMIKNLNKKGFTLVELLAVIVVLAVIILIAMPSVMNAMEKARRNSFAVEANEIVKVAQSWYANEVMTKGGNSKCVTFSTLISEGYLDKKDSGYTGKVQITVDGNGNATYKVWLSNKSHTLGAEGVSGQVESSDVKLNESGTPTPHNCSS